MRLSCIVLFLVALSACSSIPKNIKSPPVSDLQLNQIIANKQSTQGELIRWGGEIVEVENANDFSMIQVVQFPLNHYGKPQPNENSQGRFIARSTQFLDPVVYKKGSLITFSGITTTDTVNLSVDEKQVIMPIIDVTDNYRWQAYETRPSTYYHDPFYNPYHRFYYNRWYGYPWHGPRFGYRYYYH
ncbi:MAG: Slp family lipoprotein [Methylophaga sp.]|nr:Slp family lipoprotein [Methylophaga sp.]